MSMGIDKGWPRIPIGAGWWLAWDKDAPFLERVVVIIHSCHPEGRLKLCSPKRCYGCYELVPVDAGRRATFFACVKGKQL